MYKIDGNQQVKSVTNEETQSVEQQILDSLSLRLQ